MIEWGSFLVVAIAALVGASAVVAVASLGIRLLESGARARSADPRTGRIARVGARLLFGLCGLLVLYGVYLIVPVFH